MTLKTALAAVVLSFGSLAVVTASAIAVPAVKPFAVGVAALLAALGAAAFSRFAGGSWWQWGLLLGSGFWAYFLLVFFILAARGESDWQPLGFAAIVAAAGLGGGFVSSRIR